MSYKIRNWKVSYYQNDQHRWVTGLLTCSPEAVMFYVDSDRQPPQDSGTSRTDHETDSGSESPDLLVEYVDIKQVQKATSMLIYSAVTVETRDGVVHWFSSLPDRHSVYSVLHHFAHHSLLGKTGNTVKRATDPASQTRLGQRLLQSAEDSERTLAGAAGELHGQGRQLASAGIQLQEIHEDLDVADRLLSGLNTYLGRWRLPPQYKKVDPIHISKDDVPSDQDLEVLSSEIAKDQWHSQKLCILRVTENGMVLLNMKQRPLHTLRWMDLARVFIVSPWEVVLTKHVAGCADVSVSVVSASLLPVLQLLQKKVPHLVDFQTVPASVAKPDGVDRNTPRGSTKTRHSRGEADASLHPHSRGKNASINAEGGTEEPSSVQLQQGQQQQEAVSETELLALHSKLGGLKMMANAVGEELTHQNQALDDMIDSVSHADSRVRDATRRTKKLM